MASAKTQVNKISTGVVGLDEMLYGGIPEGNQMLMAGDAGTGKTLMSFEMLYRNANINIPSTFITLEEGRKSLLENVKGAFSYFDDIDDLVDRNMITVTEQKVVEAFKSRESLQSFIVGINRIIQANSSRIVVFDSISPIRPLIDSDRTFTRAISQMIENFRNLGVTSIVNVETASPTLTEVAGLYGTYMFDGIVKLSTYKEQNSFQYLITVVKMRRSNHKNSSMPFEITPKGFNIFR
jgi:KaiC/GvpD/RAD55 family RecA-like ATPase